MTFKRPRPTESTVEIQLDGKEETLPLRSLTEELVRKCEPFRDFKWHRGQKHFPGWYWSVTTGHLVPYESRLELSWLRIADMDQNVTHIAAQPFNLIGVGGGRRRPHHVPDFAWIGRDGSLGVVDAKYADQLDEEEVVLQFEWTSRALEGEGISHEVWSELSPAALQNSTFLACYRNPALHDPTILERARAILATLQPHSVHTLEAVEAHLAASTVPEARSVLFHLVWAGDLRIDLDSPISQQSLLEVT